MTQWEIRGFIEFWMLNFYNFNIISYYFLYTRSILIFISFHIKSLIQQEECQQNNLFEPSKHQVHGDIAFGSIGEVTLTN